MQEVLIATTSKSLLQEFSDNLENRNLIYSRNTNQLYIKYHGLRPRYYSVGNGDNLIIKNINGVNYLSLADDVLVNSTDVSPDNIVHNVNGLMVENAINGQNTIYLVVKVSETVNETFCGEVCRFGMNISEMYHVSISSKNKPSIVGSSGNTKSAEIKKVLFNGEEYYGIKFNSNTLSNLYFHGYSNVETLLPPMITEYTDNQITVLED